MTYNAKKIYQAFLRYLVIEWNPGHFKKSTNTTSRKNIAKIIVLPVIISWGVKPKDKAKKSKIAKSVSILVTKFMMPNINTYVAE